MTSKKRPRPDIYATGGPKKRRHTKPPTSCHIPIDRIQTRQYHRNPAHPVYCCSRRSQLFQINDRNISILHTSFDGDEGNTHSKENIRDESNGEAGDGDGGGQWEDIPEGKEKEEKKKDQVRSFAPEFRLKDRPFPSQSARARLTEFLPFVNDFITEMLGRHSDTATSTACSCSSTLEKPRLFKCLDCFASAPICEDCVVSKHLHLPFHRIGRWNGKFFDKIQLSSLGS